MSTALLARIQSPGPKKILACDGGGILGLISVEVLARIEALLRERQPSDRRDGFVLADYFDYFAGTSTGALLAGCLALGMSVERIRKFYLDSGREMFDRAGLLERLRYKYDDDKLSMKLKQEIGVDTTLGSDKLRTLLTVVMRNATTDSPWPLSNNPGARYNRRTRDDGTPRENCNLDLPLWQLLRASTAAPTFFPPEVVQIGGSSFVFVDGGVTTYNNPAFLAFTMATLDRYAVNWPTGEDKLLLVSVGTGNTAKADATLSPGQMHLLYQASTIPGALMAAAQYQQDLLCRMFGKCLAGDALDRELGDLIGAAGPVAPKLFTYLRYDADVSRDGLDALGLPQVDSGHVQLMDSTQYIDEIQQVGRALGERKVLPAHFAGFV
jgi:patatin-like phospholipase/acyl hydrolase